MSELCGGTGENYFLSLALMDFLLPLCETTRQLATRKPAQHFPCKLAHILPLLCKSMESIERSVLSPICQTLCGAYDDRLMPSPDNVRPLPALKAGAQLHLCETIQDTFYLRMLMILLEVNLLSISMAK